MKIDLTCPIEVTRTEVLSDDRGRCRGYLDIISTSDHPIRRIEGRVRWIGERGTELMSESVVFDGMRLVSHGRAQLTVAGEIPAAASIELVPSEVAFADFSTSWSDEDSDIVDYEFTPEPPSARRDRLRGIFGSDAVCYPKMRGRDWICVCGRLNPGDSQVCARCMRGRERIFAAMREQPPGDWSGFAHRLERRERFEARREELRAQSERAQQVKRERRVRTIVSVLALLLVCGALVLVGVLLGYIVF